LLKYRDVERTSRGGSGDAKRSSLREGKERVFKLEQLECKAQWVGVNLLGGFVDIIFATLMWGRVR